MLRDEVKDMFKLEFENARGPESLLDWSDIVLWGAGSYAEKVIRQLGKERVSAIYDSDARKRGTDCCGLAVQGPDQFSMTPDTAVVISVSSHIDEIASMLRSIYHVPKEQIYPIITHWSEQHRYLPELIRSHRAEVELVMSALADNESKRYFASYMNTVLTMNPTYLTCNPRIVSPYVYQGEQEWVIPRKGDCIVDCGAFTGDTMERLIHTAENDCIFWGIEPVLGNYQALCQAAKNFPNIGPIVWQYALGDRPGQIEITSEAEVTPRATIHGEYAGEDHSVTVKVPVETLDRLFSNQKVDYIKMDIEGEEVRTLMGAQSIIVRDRPTMMLSAYHMIEHLWEIPLLLQKLVPSYRIYCGHQPNALLEPEFYCIAR